LAVATLLGVLASAHAQRDPLAFFDGVWVSVNPVGHRVIFNKVGLGQRVATLPLLGPASIRVSDGRDESELMVSGAGFNCLYAVNNVGMREMVWGLKKGSAACLKSAWFKKSASEEDDVKDEIPTDCDHLAASPDDPKRLKGVRPVPFADLKADKAVSACQAARAAHGSLQRIWLQLGRAQHKAAVDKAGDKAGDPLSLIAAEEALDEAIKRDASYAVAFVIRGEVRLLRGDNGETDKYGGAIGDLTKAIGLGLKSASVYERRGYAHLRRRQHEEAIADLSEAIRLDAKLANAHYRRSVAYTSASKWDEAIADLEKARALDASIRIDPELAECYVNRGLLRYDRGEFELAISDFSDALAINPKHHRAYNNRGRAYYYHKRDYDRAMADFSKAIGNDPRNDYAYNHLGLAYFAKKDYDRAIPNFAKAIDINPGHAEAYFNRGGAYYAKKEYERAIGDYTKAIEINPGYADAYFNRGDAYYTKKEYHRAIADFSKAIEIRPRNVHAYYRRGLAREAARHHLDAIANYGNVLRIDPSGELAGWARSALARLGPAELAQLGFSVLPLPPPHPTGVNPEGLAVTEVDSSSDAAQKIRVGDVILGIGGKQPVTSAEHLAAAVREANRLQQPAVVVRIRTGGEHRFVAITLKRL